MVLCTVCNLLESRYKCPSCLVRYCSLPCFKKHKTDSCLVAPAAIADVPLPVSPSVVFNGNSIQAQELSPHIKRLLKEIPEEERLPKNRLEQMGKSEELKNLLKDVSLQQLLTKSLDVRNRREAHDHLQFLIAREPAFASFATTCLNVLAQNEPK